MPDLVESKLVAGREKVIAGIGSPLGFFVLALLIVEAFLFGAGWVFNLPTETRTHMVWAGLGTFVLIVLVVLLLVICFPQNLVFTERSHLQLALYGAKSNPIPIQVLEAAELTAPPERPLNQLPPPAQEQKEHPFAEGSKND